MNFFINGFLVVQACLGRQADYTANQFKPSRPPWFALPDCRTACGALVSKAGSAGYIGTNNSCITTRQKHSTGCQCRVGVICLSRYGYGEMRPCSMGLLCRTVCVANTTYCLV